MHANSITAECSSHHACRRNVIVRKYTSPITARDLMLRVDEGLITAVNAQSAWPVRFAFCFLRAMPLSYMRAVAFARGMLAK